MVDLVRLVHGTDTYTREIYLPPIPSQITINGQVSGPRIEYEAHKLNDNYHEKMTYYRRNGQQIVRESINDNQSLKKTLEEHLSQNHRLVRNLDIERIFYNSPQYNTPDLQQNKIGKVDPFPDNIDTVIGAYNNTDFIDSLEFLEWFDQIDEILRSERLAANYLRNKKKP